jgi:hypothetical protein
MTTLAIPNALVGASAGYGSSLSGGNPWVGQFGAAYQRALSRATPQHKWRQVADVSDLVKRSGVYALLHPDARAAVMTAVWGASGAAACNVPSSVASIAESLVAACVVSASVSVVDPGDELDHAAGKSLAAFADSCATLCRLAGVAQPGGAVLRQLAEDVVRSSTVTTATAAVTNDAPQEEFVDAARIGSAAFLRAHAVALHQHSHVQKQLDAAVASETLLDYTALCSDGGLLSQHVPACLFETSEELLQWVASAPPQRSGGGSPDARLHGLRAQVAA